MNTPTKVAIGSVLGFALGGALVGGFVYFRFAHHHQTSSEQALSVNGIKVVRWDGFDYDGMGFMEPNGSSLTAYADGGLPITIYQSRRMFQEGYPMISDLKVQDGRLVWSDGVFSYELGMREVAGGGSKP